MKNQVLSIEQMKHLKELGVDTSKASMYWDMPTIPDYNHKLGTVWNKNLKSAEDVYGHRSRFKERLDMG